MGEIVDGRWTTTDGRTPEHWYTLSSPCEPNGSGELIIKIIIIIIIVMMIIIIKIIKLIIIF